MNCRFGAAAAGLLLVLTGCGSEPPDYQSIWATTPSTTALSTTSEAPVPFAQYLQAQGVKGVPVHPDELDDLTVTLPRPKGWTDYQNPNLAEHTVAIARGGDYPTAMVLVFRLHGGFDVEKAIQGANNDARLSPEFTELNESLEDFAGFPSAMIEGSYQGPDLRRLHTYSRVVIPVTPAPEFQRYLVQLTVTGLADQAFADSDDIEAIIGGFNVEVK